MSGKRQPYARLVKVLGRLVVFRVRSRSTDETYHVTIRRLTDADYPVATSCPCIAGGFGAYCFHKRRALASYGARVDPKLKKGRRPVAIGA